MDFETEMNRRLAEILKTEIRPLPGEQKLTEIRGWDSLRFMRLLMSLEKDWGLRFQASEVVNLKTWAELLGLVRAKKAI